MQGDVGMLEFLNEHLAAELGIINQYFLNSRMLQNWGFPGLARLFHDLSMGEMNDAAETIDRVLYFEGHPNLQRLGPVRIGETPLEMIELGLECEREAIERLQRGVEAAVDKRDAGTRAMLEAMLRDEEEHADAFESQLEAIERIGIDNYLARYAMPAST